MRLTDLQPAWLRKDGNAGAERVAFVFNVPHRPHVRIAVFPAPAPPLPRQYALFAKYPDAVGDGEVWSTPEGSTFEIEGGIVAASFETMTVTPHVGHAGLHRWYGTITNGEVTEEA